MSRIQDLYPPVRDKMMHWEYECPKTGLIKSVYWDIHNIFGTRMRGRGVFHNTSWERCLKRYASGVSLSRLADIKKSPEWLDAIKEYLTENWIVITASDRGARIFGISEEKGRVLFHHSMDILRKAYKLGVSYTEVKPHWNDKGYIGKK